MRELETIGQHVEAFGHSLKHVSFNITILNYIPSWKHNENLPKEKHKDIDFEVLRVLGTDLQSAKVHLLCSKWHIEPREFEVYNRGFGAVPGGLFWDCEGSGWGC
jgi:hypothetical protein